jgi:hypothetical protein
MCTFCNDYYSDDDDHDINLDGDFEWCDDCGAGNEYECTCG